MFESTGEFVTNLVNNVSYMPCPGCGSLGYEPALRSAPSSTSR